MKAVTKFMAVVLMTSVIGGVAQAFTTSSIFTQIIQSEEFQGLEKTLEANGFTLSSISDSGNRYRCMCYDYNVEFKNQDNNVKIQKVIRVQQNKVEIKE